MPFKRIQASGTTIDPETTFLNFDSLTASKSGDVTTLTTTGAETVTIQTASTKVLTPIVDAIAAGALSLGPTTATSIAMGANVTVAAGKSITPNATGGLAPATAGFTTFWTANAGAIVATSGTDTACDNGSIWWCAIMVPYNCTITGIGYLIGSVGGTDKAIVGLYSSAGALLASSDLAGTTVGTAANFQPLDFTATYAAKGPALFYAAVQFNGATAKFRSHPGPGLKVVASNVAGTFGTMASITPGTTFTASKGPVAFTY